MTTLIDSKLLSPGGAMIERPKDRWAQLDADLANMSSDMRRLNIDTGRLHVAELKPGQGYFQAMDGALHIGPWDRKWIRLKDGEVARAIGQVALPR